MGFMDGTSIDYSYISFYFFIIKYEDRLCDHSLYNYEHNNKVKLSKGRCNQVRSIFSLCAGMKDMFGNIVGIF